MIPLEQSFNNMLILGGGVVNLLIICAVILVPLFLLHYATNACLLGHDYRMKKAENHNGTWVVERVCDRCGQRLEEITDTAHFRVGRT